MPDKRGNLLVWGLDEIEPSTIAQAERTAALPFVEKPMALMPDAHVGIGATVGSVAFMRGAIVPSAVGVDIGCGMIAARTNLVLSELPDDLSSLLSLVEEAIPAGLGKGHKAPSELPAELRTESPATSLGERDRTRIAEQFGTLGSGNHFFEVCHDEQGRVWVVLHSGSRGIGNTLARLHIEEAKGDMRRYFIELEDPDLAYLVEGTPAFERYVHDMLWAQEYARLNRERMMEEALRVLGVVMQRGVEVVERVNCHHNFAALEHHRGRNGWVIRKGAIRARKGDRGIIPGSMGTGTFIVTGLGNPASFESCSHGAGRRLSRGQARKQLSEESLAEAMTGVTWQSRDARALLDEHPLSYKDVEAVMAAQADLVTVDHRLRQVLNYKGTK